ncbi:MAG: hypothetical protein A2Y10_09920 [Planctomycetes bacterium GWF2_41_51]|nr:MAG: hypothetical protein A2Y10_09920 [Planctomycetes bacterium GWF2_41_51]HBG27426.1 hypothetical protein [Phycisphaerales bacterium]
MCLITFIAGNVRATAIDIDPPSWWLTPGLDTTWQVWSFGNSGTGPIEPDSAGYDSFLGTHVTVSPQSNWLAEYNQFDYYGLIGGSGIWQLSGSGIDAYVVNYDQPASEKHIWIQLTWRSQQQGGAPVIYLQDDTGSQIGPFTSHVSYTWLNDYWIHSTYEIILDHNTSFEIINISGSIYVDDLVIDTLCIPEPATISLLIIGTLLFYRK